MKNVHDILTWANIIGLPALFTTMVWFCKKILGFGKQMKILMDAQQKQMRRDLTQDYHKYMSQGYIDDDDLDMWESAYQAYHALGVNGIMDSRRDSLIQLNSEHNSKKGI